MGIKELIAKREEICMAMIEAGHREYNKLERQLQEIELELEELGVDVETIQFDEQSEGA